MLRFFEPDADSWWPAAAPPQPSRHYLAAGDSRRQGGGQYHQRRAAPALPAPLAGRRVPSALATVDLVKGRWFPSPAPASNVSRSSSPNSSSSVDSMNSYGGSGMNNCRPSSGTNISRDSASERSFSPFQGERGSAMTVDTATKTQDQRIMDWTNKRRMIDERHKMNNMEVSVRQSKKQKTHVEEENLRSYLPSFESTSSPTRMIATNQNLKVVPISKSKKMGDKITALQQLVSPFGKTDTASVLHEATVYIKALQEQIKLLSNPYLESTSSLKSMQAKDGGESHRRLPKRTIRLREAGLCLVPISPAITSLVDQLQLDGCVSESLPW